MKYPIDEQWFVRRWLEAIEKPDDEDEALAKAIVRCINSTYGAGRRKTLMGVETDFTDEELVEIYCDFLENHEEQAPEDVRISYSRMCNAFDEYLNAIQGSMFRQAFRFGYRHKEMEYEEKSLQLSR